MRLKVGFCLIQCDDAGSPEATIVEMQQVFVDLDARAMTLLPRLEGMRKAYDQAFGVTQRQLDEAKADYAEAQTAVRPIFDAAGATVARFLFAKAVEHFAEPEPATETMGADG